MPTKKLMTYLIKKACPTVLQLQRDRETLIIKSERSRKKEPQTMRHIDKSDAGDITAEKRIKIAVVSVKKQTFKIDLDSSKSRLGKGR
jgi:hypothetical protein